MTVRLEGITVLADDVAQLAAFYEQALDLAVVAREESYVAFGGQGIRFAIFSRQLMAGNTDGHPSYATQFTGQAFELNFQCDTPAEVVRRYDEIVLAGATPAGATGSPRVGPVRRLLRRPGRQHPLCVRGCVTAVGPTSSVDPTP